MNDENKLISFITNPLSKLIAFFMNVIVASVFCNIIVMDSLNNNVFDIKLVVYSKFFPWFILYLIMMFLFFCFLFSKERKMHKEYLDMYSMEEVIEKARKESVLNVSKKFDKLVSESKDVDDVLKIIEARESVERGWNNGD